MSDYTRYDVLVVREGEKGGDKAWWTKIGAAFDKGTGTISIVLDAHPIGNKMILKIPTERQDQGGGGGGGQQRQQGNPPGRSQGRQQGGFGQRGGQQLQQQRQPQQGSNQQRYRQRQTHEPDFGPGEGLPPEEFFEGDPSDNLNF